MARVFIIHGWSGYPEEGIFPWLKEELEKKGFEVHVPAMPNPDSPEIKIWLEFLREQIGAPDEDTILFGHSIGAQAILRYLETLPDDQRIKGAVFLAGWVHLEEESFENEGDEEIAGPWLELPIDWQEIKAKAGKITAIFSDNDYFVPLGDSEIFREKLGAEIIIEKGKGHFSGSDGIKELPSALDAVLKL